MKDMTKTMDITMKEQQQQEAAASADAATATTQPSTTHPPSEKSDQAAFTQGQTAAASTAPATADAPPTYASPSYNAPNAGAALPTEKPQPDVLNPYSQERPKGIPMRPALMPVSEEEAALNAAGVTEEEKQLRDKQAKKGGLSKEQRDELRQYEIERNRIRDERVETLSNKLIDRMSVWTETDKGADVTKAFSEKIRLEIENLKMESFGLEILHAVGNIYLSKGSGMLKSHRGLFGISGFWSRLKDKGAMAKDTWGTISTAIDAQMSMEEMAKAEERGGEDWTDERRAEHEKRVTGKILAAAWRGSKFEIQSVLRDVCDKVLNDKRIRSEKRLERAEALVLMGDMLRKAERDPEEVSFVTVVILLLTMLETGFERFADKNYRKVISWSLNSLWLRRKSSETRKKRRKRRISIALIAIIIRRKSHSPRRHEHVGNLASGAILCDTRRDDAYWRVVDIVAALQCMNCRSINQSVYQTMT